MAHRPRPSVPGWTRFTPDLADDLKAVVGKTHADHLLPRLDDAADKMRSRQRTKAISDTYRKPARNRAKVAAKVAKRIETLTGRLLSDLEKASPVIREAVARGHLPRGYDPSAYYTLATIGQKTNKPRQPVSDIRATLANLSHDAREWEKKARAASKGKPGRKSIRERLLLAKWVGNELADIGIPLTKASEGDFARVVGIVYEAAGIPKPTDLYRDVAAALDDPKAYWRGGDNLMALPRPPRKPLHKYPRRQRIV